MMLGTEFTGGPTVGQRSLEALLGPAEDRYFGAGFRSVRYSLRSVSAMDTSSGEAVGEITYPSRWSVSGDGLPRAPHLSSIDAVVLSLRVVERLASREEWRSVDRMRVASIELRAGSSPWLTLDAVPVRVTIEHGAHPEHRLTAVVGNIRVGATLVESSQQDHCEITTETAGDETVYGGLFQSTNVRSHIQNVDESLQVLRGTHEVILDAVTTAGFGLESSQWPAPTIIDYLVTMGQLTQALVYTSGGTARSEAGPLWMRTMTIRIDQPPLPFPVRFETTTQILRDRVLDRGGNRVHNVLVESTATSGVSARSTLAYNETPA